MPGRGSVACLGSAARFRAATGRPVFVYSEQMRLIVVLVFAAALGAQEQAPPGLVRGTAGEPGGHADQRRIEPPFGGGSALALFLQRQNVYRARAASHCGAGFEAGRFDRNGHQPFQRPVLRPHGPRPGRSGAVGAFARGAAGVDVDRTARRPDFHGNRAAVGDDLDVAADAAGWAKDSFAASGHGLCGERPERGFIRAESEHPGVRPGRAEPLGRPGGVPGGLGRNPARAVGIEFPQPRARGRRRTGWYTVVLRWFPIPS